MIIVFRCDGREVMCHKKIKKQMFTQTMMNVSWSFSWYSFIYTHCGHKLPRRSSPSSQTTLRISLFWCNKLFRFRKMRWQGNSWSHLNVHNYPECCHEIKWQRIYSDIHLESFIITVLRCPTAQVEITELQMRNVNSALCCVRNIFESIKNNKKKRFHDDCCTLRISGNFGISYLAWCECDNIQWTNKK